MHVQEGIRVVVGREHVYNGLLSKMDSSCVASGLQLRPCLGNGIVDGVGGISATARRSAEQFCETDY